MAGEPGGVAGEIQTDGRCEGKKAAWYLYSGSTDTEQWQREKTKEQWENFYS